MKLLKSKKRTIINVITAVIIVVFCVTVVAAQKNSIPDNPISDKEIHIDSETMLIPGSNTSKDSNEHDSSKSQIENPGNDKSDKQNEENDNKQNRTKGAGEDKTLDSKGNDNDKKGVDGINDSDEASDNEGNGKTGEESLFPDGKDEARIATDLKNQIITEKQLTDNNFGFYAYIVDGEKSMNLKIKLRNSATRQNGEYLKDEGKNHEVKLARGYNYISLYIKEGSQTYYQITYAINYMADKADENKPNVGEHPPIIKTNLDTWEGNIKNKNFIFTVEALSYKGKDLPYDNIKVTFDDVAITFPPTGDGIYEYDLYFKNIEGVNTSQHRITVLAWDNEGNSSYKTYSVTYENKENGSVIGKTTVTVDATTLGLGIIAGGYEYEIKQGEPASYAVLAALKAYGFDASYSGTADTGFYLRGISKGGIGGKAHVPSNLWQKIIDDGLSTTGQGSSNGIFEFDYTQGSGWMYTINGALYPGRGMSNYYLNDGDQLTLRFTLAYGKDLGSTSGYGLLNSYCGAWINGGFVSMHRLDDGKVIKEATCESPGIWARRCTVENCREQITETIPPLGHDYVEIMRDEETGQITYQCRRCKALYVENYTP